MLQQLQVPCALHVDAKEKLNSAGVDQDRFWQVKQNKGGRWGQKRAFAKGSEEDWWRQFSSWQLSVCVVTVSCVFLSTLLIQKRMELPTADMTLLCFLSASLTQSAFSAMRQSPFAHLPSTSLRTSFWAVSLNSEFSHMELFGANSACLMLLFLWNSASSPTLESVIIWGWGWRSKTAVVQPISSLLFPEPKPDISAQLQDPDWGQLDCKPRTYSLWYTHDINFYWNGESLIKRNVQFLMFCFCQKGHTCFHIFFLSLQSENVTITSVKLERQKLLPGHRYEARVRTRASLGHWSRWSSVVTWQTKDGQSKGNFLPSFITF